MAEQSNYTIRGNDVVSWRGTVMFTNEDPATVREVCRLLNSVYLAGYNNARGDAVEHGGQATWC